jgi:hypothetical protein
MMKISSRGVHCPRSIACGLEFPPLLDERVDSLLCKDNNHVIKFIYLRHWFSVFTFWSYV